MPTEAQAGAILTIDLGAIVANWRLLAERVRPARCAAVVKADAYGLGANQVAPALAAAGCRTFFVAHIAEAIALRPLLPGVAIAVLHGPPPSAEADFVAHGVTAVLNTPDQVARLAAHGRATGHACPAILHVDTGMNRLGLAAAEAAALADDPHRLSGLDVRAAMSHLACADDPGHPLNETQLGAFASARALFPRLPASLANSSGIFLGQGFHFDLVRPGAALYGVNPHRDQGNPMRAAVGLAAPILQVRRVDSSQTVGYGATARVPGGTRLATVAVGYADGYLRALGNRGTATVGGIGVPLVGRVSMDLATFDVSALPDDLARPGVAIDLIGPHHSIDALADEGGTIGYEILTALGRRYHRRYGGAAAAP